MKKKNVWINLMEKKRHTSWHDDILISTLASLPAHDGTVSENFFELR